LTIITKAQLLLRLPRSEKMRMHHFFRKKWRQKRAYAVVNYIMPKSGICRLHFCRRRYGSSFS